MRSCRWASSLVALAVALLVSGCGTPREKTAPCKRPANLTSYAAAVGDCGPMMVINADRGTALAAIQELAGNDE